MCAYAFFIPYFFHPHVVCSIRKKGKNASGQIRARLGLYRYSKSIFKKGIKEKKRKSEPKKEKKAMIWDGELFPTTNQ